jgi:uncharacterized protein YoxC
MNEENMQEQKSEKQKAFRSSKKITARKIKRKPGNDFFIIIIVLVGALAIISLFWTNTKEKIKEIKSGGERYAEQLEGQVKILNDELAALRAKTENLEKENINNKEVVLEMFENNRKLPANVAGLSNWNTFSDENFDFTVQYPEGWENVRAVFSPENAEDSETKHSAAVFQPEKNSDFMNAIVIKEDYFDFWNMSLREKEKIFAELIAMDKKEIAGGMLIYFLNFDKENREIPTVLVLLEKKIYRISFTIINKQFDRYLEYRKNFEEMAITFNLKEKAVEPELKNTKR